MRKRIFMLLAFLLILIAASAYAQNHTAHIHVFYGQGCPHCGSLLDFLEGMEGKYSNLVVHNHEVYFDDDERELFWDTAKAFETEIRGVPTVFIGQKVIVGFSNAIGTSIEHEIQRCLLEECGDPIATEKTEETVVVEGESSPAEHPEKKAKEGMAELTIPIVLSAAAVDAINPCAFAVLIILMTVALTIADKRRALKFGLAFTVSIYISYFLIGLGLFTALQATGLSRNFYIVVTVLAVLVGLFNIKDYFWYGKGFLMEVPLSWRPAMKRVIRSATSPIGAFIVGFAVSLFELPCTGGPYIVILGLLAHEVSRSAGILYLLLYNLVFVSPLILLSLIIYKGIASTEKLESIRQCRIRLLHLIAGIIMLAIASIMIYALRHGWV